MNPHNALYALGAILLGAVGIWFRDFALQWQPVPKGIPARALLACLSGGLLAAGGVLLLLRRWSRAAALLLAAFYGSWVVALHFPLAMKSWRSIGAWNGPAEITFLTMGGVALFASGAAQMRATLELVARLLAGASAVVFGLAHFNYIDLTASFVPKWIPPHGAFWAWATGAGHLIAGLALLTGIMARLAATLLAAMMASFVVLVHIPRVLASPGAHVEWAMLGVATALTGAAWLIRRHTT
jgi:uncharacterized membrane protein YphA (DoxX/SURF4 family)